MESVVWLLVLVSTLAHTRRLRRLVMECGKCEAEQTTGSMTNVGCTHPCGGLRHGVEGTEGGGSRNGVRE